MMINKTKNKIIAKKSKICGNFFCKFLGLMFSKKKEDFALIFEFKKEKRLSLHTFFVFYPIDIIFLDKSKKVVEMKKGMKPFSVYFPKQKFSYVIELNAGAIRRTKTELADEIKF